MNAHEVLANLIAELGERLGAPLALDANGVCGMQYGDEERDIVIELPDGQDDFLIYAPVLDGPAPDEATYLRQLLEMSFLGQETGGCCLGVDPEEDRVVLSFQQSLDGLAVGDLENLLQSFIDAVEDVRAKLLEEAESREEPSRPESDASDVVPGMRV